MAGEVIAVDINPEHLELASRLGADKVTLSSAGMDLDAAVEAVGLTATVDIAIRSVKKGGTVALIGNLSPQVTFPLQEVVNRQISVNGSYGSEGDYPECFELIASGAVKVEPMITGRASLEETARYFERLYRQEPGLMKVLVCP